MKELIYYLKKGVDFDDFTDLTTKLLHQKTTTNKQKDTTLLNYTELNLVRMNRLLKTIKISPKIISKINEKKNHYTLLVLTEGWCGDASQVLPILRNLELASSFIDLKIILRDENLELMDEFQTNGTRSIPKVLIIKNYEIIENWGPRPKELMKLTAEFKANDQYSKADFVNDVQKWFNKDKGKTTLKEIISLLS
ncbi:MAG: thioredoxin family protein [Flavobacteriales bacterium]